MKQPRPEHLVEEQRGMAEVVYVGSACWWIMDASG